MSPVISVIVTTHNRPELLRRALASILQQGDLVEIIVCSDEGSCETRQVATDLLRPTDSFAGCPRLKGPSETRNLGIRIAKGKWVYFLDDDDTIEPYFFFNLRHVLDDAKHVVFTNYMELREDRLDGKAGDITGKRYVSLKDMHPDRLLVANFIPVHAMLIPRVMLNSITFNSSLVSHEDWDFILKLKKKFSFQHAEVDGLNYHISNSDSRNRMTPADFVDIYKTIYRRHPVINPRIWRRRAKRLAALAQGN